MEYRIKENETDAAMTLIKALAHAYDTLTASIMELGYGYGIAGMMGDALTKAISHIKGGCITEEECDAIEEALAMYYKKCMAEAKEEAKKKGELTEVKKVRDEFEAGSHLIARALIDIEAQAVEQALLENKMQKVNKK